MTSARRWLTVGVTVAVVLVLDQLSKRWAVDRLKDQAPIDLFWTLRFNYAENTGMAFSRGSGAGRFIAVLVVAIVVVLIVVARKMTSRLQLVLVGVVIGGALGNLVDRIFRAGDGGFLTGGVVDFVDVQWWPIFNVADACVVVGGIALALTGLRAPEDPPPDEPEPDDPTSQGSETAADERSSG